ncbi:MAG: hypothetical protein KGJ86_07765 [Chloroflexota bacterium]|nr:hypothetical protein [Chloroflexota bacterium]
MNPQEFPQTFEESQGSAPLVPPKPEDGTAPTQEGTNGIRHSSGQLHANPLGDPLVRFVTLQLGVYRQDVTVSNIA